MNDKLSLFDITVELPADANLTEATLPVPAGAGVCLFTNQHNQPILLIHGGNLRTIVRNRLAEPDPDEKTRRTRLRPITTRLCIRSTYSAFETQLSYFHLAAALYPQRQQEFFPHLKLHLLSINLTAQYPCLQVTNRFDAENSLYWGPFSTAKSAQEYLQILQEVFDLCRRDDLLTQAPHAHPCPYGQMSRCITACDGTASPQQYRHGITQAIEFLDDPHHACAGWREKMKDLAAELNFEQAQRLKLRAAQAEKLLTDTYRWVKPLPDFAVLAFQSGPRQKIGEKPRAEPTISPFVIGPGWVSQIEPFPLSDPLAPCQGLIDHLQLTRFQADNTPTTEKHARIFAWVARLLYGTTRDKGLYLPVDSLPDARQLAQNIVQHFAQPEKPKKKKPDLDTMSLNDASGQDASRDSGQENN